MHEPSLRLRSRILIAIGVTAVACGKRPVHEETSAAAPDAGRQARVAEIPSTRAASPEPAPRPPPMPEEICLTRGEVRAQLESPYGQILQPSVCRGAGCAPFLDKNGCADRQYISTGCCNPALSGPVVKGGRCCYTHQLGSCCGRPFVVDGAPRIARGAARSDWGDDGAPVVDAGPHRARLAALWLEDALAEHASVASFARFTLDLLAAGAPPDLVAAAQEAGLDEIAHARASFAIASSLAREPLGPGPLDVGGGRRGTTLEDVIVATFDEGCVGETVASALAAARASLPALPNIRAALARIADDEARHAELAWRVVAWALREHPELRPAIERRLGAASPDLAAHPREVPVDVLHTYGLLDESEALAVARSAFADVVAPCAAALLASSRTAGGARPRSVRQRDGRLDRVAETPKLNSDEEPNMCS